MEFAKESTNLLELITRLTLNQPILQPPMQQQGGGYGGRQQGAAAGRHMSTVPHEFTDAICSVVSLVYGLPCVLLCFLKCLLL